MARRNPWTRTYQPITPEAFAYAARKLGLPVRDRPRVYQWARYVEAKEGVWPSAAHAVHTWITGQLALRMERSGSRSTEPDPGLRLLP